MFRISIIFSIMNHNMYISYSFFQMLYYHCFQLNSQLLLCVCFLLDITMHEFTYGHFWTKHIINHYYHLSSFVFTGCQFFCLSGRKLCIHNLNFSSTEMCLYGTMWFLKLYLKSAIIFWSYLKYTSAIFVVTQGIAIPIIMRRKNNNEKPSLKPDVQYVFVSSCFFSSNTYFRA